MSRPFPLEALITVQQRRLEQAMAALQAANLNTARCREGLLAAQRGLDAVRRMRQELQQRRAGSAGAVVSLTELSTAAQRLGWVEDRIEQAMKLREQARSALDAAEAAAAKAREHYRRMHARRDGLLEQRARWLRQQAAQRLRAEELNLEDLPRRQAAAGS